MSSVGGRELRSIAGNVKALKRMLFKGSRPLLNHSCSWISQAFIDARYKNPNRPTTDEEITGLLIAALFAGQHTSSITSTWTGFYLHT